MSDAGNRMIASARNALAFARGEQREGFKAHIPPTVDVRAIRKRLGMTQSAFAMRYGFSKGAVADWEQGRKHPENAARVLLRVIEMRPDAVAEALEVA